MSSTSEASIFMWKEYSENLHSIKNKKTGQDLTMKQMFDISEKLIVEQSDEIYGVNTINWEWFCMETFIFGQWWRNRLTVARKGLRIFGFCVMLWKDEREPTIKCCLGRQVDVVQEFTTTQSFGHNWWWANGIRVEYFTGFTSLQLCDKVQEFMSKMSEKPEDVQRHLKTMNRNANEAPTSFLFMREDYHQEDGHSSDLYQKRSGILFMKANTQGEWDGVTELMTLTFSESGHPVFRSTSPLSRGVLRNTGGGKLSIHFGADGDTVETVFRTIISVNQLSIYGAVSHLCEEYKSCHVRTERLVLAEQSDPLFVPKSSLMKTHIPLTDDPAQEDLLEKYQQRVDKLSQQNRVIKFCTDVGFLTAVDVGQYFMTKGHWRILTIYRTSDMSWVQFCHEMKIHLTRKVGFEGTPKLGPYWK